MLELRAVSGSAGREPVLARVSMVFPSASVTSVLGLSAAARHRLARLLTGADALRDGQVLIGGADRAQVIGRAQGIGRAWGLARTQGKAILTGPLPGAAGGRRPRDLLARALRAGGTPRGAIRTESERLAIGIGLGGQLDGRVRDLEAEQAVRMMFACAFAARPAAAVFDHPLEHLAERLGPDTQARLLGDIERQSIEAGVATIWLAGSAAEAQAIGGQVLVLDAGRVAALGPASEVFARPATLAVARATADPVLNCVALAAKDGAWRLADGSRFEPPANVLLPEAACCTLAFRPADLLLARADDAAVRFVARMEGETTVGGRDYVCLGFAGESWVAPRIGPAPPIGVTLNAFIDRARLMVFGADGARVG